MYYVYFLQSLKDKGYYIGCTQDLSARLEYHNSGKVKSTRSRRPLRLIYYEQYEDKSTAYKREYFLKKPQGYQEKLKVLQSLL